MQEERQLRIQEQLLKHGRLRVDELAEAFAVTPMTIRRDLAAMEQQGILTRTHGGCVLQPAVVTELPFTEKNQRQQAEKQAIARAVVQRLCDNAAIYLDTGTTSVQVARILPADRGFKVFTNNLQAVFELFARPGIDVIVYGGCLASQSPDLVGEGTLNQIQQYCLDVAVVGGDALDVDKKEFYAADMATARLSNAAQQQADQVFICVDSSKFGKRSLCLAGPLEGALLITDAGVPTTTRSTLKRSGIQAIYVKP